MLKFKELYELWRRDNLLTQALNDSHIMLENTYEMFTESVESLRQRDDGKISEDVYKKDKIINKFEQEVRTKVLKHLAITGGANLIPGLILTSIVIDMERIGDFTKNITDLARVYPKKLTCGETCDIEVQKIETATEEMFKNTVSIIKTSNKDAALELIQDNRWVIKKCDQLLLSLIQEKDQSLTSGTAVTIALYIRYLKRITAHLINILTSVTTPYSRIGFLGEEEKEK